jgi:ribosomal protein L29
MKTSELKDYSVEALQNEKPTRLRELRREIAQIKTVLRELDLGLRENKEEQA